MTEASQEAAQDLEPDAAGEASEQPHHEVDAGVQAEETPPAAGGLGPEDEPLAQMQSRIAELTADLQRLQAEYLNYKRRVDRDREVVLQNAKVNVLTALLPVLDDIDRAREHEELSGGFKAVAEGVERVVSGAGLLKFGAPGDEFDPRLHEALSHGYAEPGDGVTTTSCQYVVQAGYQIGDRVVRPAKVTVVEPPAGGEAPPADGEDGEV